MDLSFPRGVRDFLPNEALFRNELVRKVEEVYRRFGFLSIDTPVFESLQVLKAKDAIGSENKLIYELKNENLGLRYDHTVSLARYYAMHQELPLPFKRYYTGKLYRLEEPQKNRYREFTQADVDILGGRFSYTDAEVIAASARVLESLGIGYEIRVGDRRFIDAALAKLGIPQNLHLAVFRAVDKLDKIGQDGVVELLNQAGIPDAQLSGIVEFINFNGNNDEKLEYVSRFVDLLLVSEFRTLLGALSLYGLSGIIKLDLSLVRGIDYYTSTVFEYKSLGGSVTLSIGGGGRYDNLIALYSGRKVPAVGSSLGIDRMLDLLNYGSSIQYSYTTAVVCYIKEANLAYALKIANKLRESGINTDVNLASRNIANQLAYANSMGAKYAAIVGDAEERDGKLKLRNMSSGEELVLDVAEAAKKMHA